MRKLKQLQRPSTATAFHSLCLTVDNYASSGWLTTPVTKDARAAFRRQTGRHRKLCRIVTAAARAPMGKCHRSPRAEYSDIFWAEGGGHFWVSFSLPTLLLLGSQGKPSQALQSKLGFRACDGVSRFVSTEMKPTTLALLAALCCARGWC